MKFDWDVIRKRLAKKHSSVRPGEQNAEADHWLNRPLTINNFKLRVRHHIKTVSARGRELDKLFDERMDRIDQNLEKSKKSQEAIDKWLNRHPSR